MTAVVRDILPSNRSAAYELIEGSSLRCDATPAKIQIVGDLLHWFDALGNLWKKNREQAAQFVKDECRRVMDAIPALTESVDAIAKHVEYCKKLQKERDESFVQALCEHTTAHTVTDVKIALHVVIAVEQLRHISAFEADLSPQLGAAMSEIFVLCNCASVASPQIDVAALRAMVGSRNSSVDCGIITLISELLLRQISATTRVVLMHLLEYETRQFIRTYGDLDAYTSMRGLVSKFINNRIEYDDLLDALLNMDIEFTTRADTVEKAISACLQNLYTMLHQTNSVFLTLFTLANLALFLFKIEPVVWCAEEIPFDKALSTIANWAFKCYLAYVDSYEMDEKERKGILRLFRAALVQRKLSRVKFNSQFINPHVALFGQIYSADVGRVLGEQLTPHRCCFHVARAIAIETGDEFLDWALALEASVSPANVDARGLRNYSNLQGLIPIDETQKAANQFHKLFQQNKNYANLLAVQS